MAQQAAVRIDRLDAGLILAPERYDPRRRGSSVATSAVVADLVEIVTEQVTPGKARGTGLYLVLDTSDAINGVILTSNRPTTVDTIGSAKKVVHQGDVIISRLRPYLRQVAYVDAALIDRACRGITVCCSTEFYVLRSRDDHSIAFLVPYLLSNPVQEILLASQEGGNHPRFSRAVLESLAIPEALAVIRDEISSTVETAVGLARNADLGIHSLVARCSEIQSLSPC